MASKTTSSGKVKVTASLDAELVKTIDEFLKESVHRSRSQFIQDVLREWQEKQKRQEIERQTEEYYLSLSDEEHEEDRNWHEIATQAAHHLWEE